MKTDFERLIPAPIDGKHLISEWIYMFCDEAAENDDNSHGVAYYDCEGQHLIAFFYYGALTTVKWNFGSNMVSIYGDKHTEVMEYLTSIYHSDERPELAHSVEHFEKHSSISYYFKEGL